MIATAMRALRVPLIALITVAAIGASLLYYIDFTLEKAQRRLAQQENLLRDARARLHKVGEERETIVRYLASYQHLQQIGFIGDEQRINWLDGLRVANLETRLYGVDYQIAAQQPYPYAAELDPGQMALYQSVMKISFRMLHEGDLMRFLRALAAQGVGVFLVNQCVIERIDSGGGIRNQPNLRANCELAWLTLRQPAPEDKKL